MSENGKRWKNNIADWLPKIEDDNALESMSFILWDCLTKEDGAERAQYLASIIGLYACSASTEQLRELAITGEEGEYNG